MHSCCSCHTSLVLLCRGYRGPGRRRQLLVLFLPDGLHPGLVLDLHHYAAHHGHDSEGLACYQTNERARASYQNNEGGDVRQGKFNNFITLQSFSGRSLVGLKLSIAGSNYYAYVAM